MPCGCALMTKSRSPGTIARMSNPSPSGAQWLISHGDQRACVVEVGGGLREYAAGGRDIAAGYSAADLCAHGRGQVLMPWPNRLRDGVYLRGGTPQQLPITEVARHNASHGLVRWALWELVHHESDHLEVRYRLHPQPGWSWHLDLRQRYHLADDGLTVTVSATNLSTTPAPFGFAAHPYVATHGTPADQVTLQIPAERLMTVDPERLLPTGIEPVAGTAYDFREERSLEQAGLLDTAYTGLARAGERWRVLVGAGADRVAVWGGPGLEWVQVFSEKVALPQAGTYPPGIAVEPMSCPADAFNSGIDLVRIAPGETWRAQWGMSRA